MKDSGKSKEASAPIVSAALEAWAVAGKREVIRIAGASMRPMLGNGSRVLVQFGAQDFRVGDVVVFRQGDTMTIHRIVRITYRYSDAMFHTKGDGSFNFDPDLLNERDAIGKVVGIVRNERVINIESGFLWIVGRVLAFFSYLFGSAVKRCKRALGAQGGHGGGDFRKGR